MCTIVFRAFLAFVIVAATGALAPAAEPIDWEKYRIEWRANMDKKTIGIANLEHHYRDGRCPYQETERKKNDCFAAFNDLIARRVSERKILGDLIAATYLSPAERNKLVDRLYKEYEKADAETTLLAEKAKVTFKPPWPPR